MARTKNVARLPPSNASRGLPGNVQPDPGYQQPPRPKSQSSSQADETWLENAPDQQPLAALSGNEDKRNEDKKNEEDVVGDGGAEHDDSILMPPPKKRKRRTSSEGERQMASPQPKITRLSSLDSIADIQDRIEQLESALATLKAKYQKLASRKKGKARASGTGLLGGHHTNTDDDNDDAGASFVWDNRSDWARYIRERQKELVEEWNKVVKNGDEEGQDRVYERTNAWDTVLDITR